MAGKREQKREKLKTGLIAAARGRIECGGLASLRARDVTSDVGCALGGLYTAFTDLDDLILHVNGGTLAALDAALADASAGSGSPRRRLKALAHRYARFASEEKALWEALFDFRVAEDRDVPEFVLARLESLLSHIARPLEAMLTEASEEEIGLRARTIFGAVHGIVTVSLQRRAIGVPESDLDGELDIFVDSIVRAAAPGG